jgi:hypothetical protein
MEPRALINDISRILDSRDREHPEIIKYEASLALRTIARIESRADLASLDLAPVRK